MLLMLCLTYCLTYSQQTKDSHDVLYYYKLIETIHSSKSTQSVKKSNEMYHNSCNILDIGPYVQ